MSNNTVEAARVQAVQQALDLLGEHFDNVQLFCSSYSGSDSSNTRSGSAFVSKGVGNFFANYGLVRQWIQREEAIMAAEGTIMELDARDTDKEDNE